MTALNESRTRALLINPQFVAARWRLDHHTKVQFEVPVDGYDPAPWNGITDYCLYNPNGEVLSVVEGNARRSRRPSERPRLLRKHSQHRVRIVIGLGKQWRFRHVA